ncbi:MAG: hypothetical protein AAF941_02405 [Pseudomonadota bacterium]
MSSPVASRVDIGGASINFLSGSSMARAVQIAAILPVEIRRLASSLA